MKLDTSSYYPKSPLDDDDPDYSAYQPGHKSGHKSEPAHEPGHDDNSGLESDPVRTIENTIAEGDRQAAVIDDESTVYDPEQPYTDEPETAAEHAVTSAATAVSWLLVPLLMPVYGIILIFSLSILQFVPAAPRLTFIGLVALIDVALPAMLVLLLKKLGMIQDIGLNGRKERLIPYIISILCMGGTAWLLWSKQFPVWVAMFYVAGAVAALVELIINFRWKISVHAAGIAGIVALLIRMSHLPYFNPALDTWLIIAILCAGLVGSSRLWLHRHTLWQVLAGYAVGFCSVYFLTAVGAA